MAERSEATSLQTLSAPSPANRAEAGPALLTASHPVVDLVRHQTEARFGRQGMMCSESVFTVLNETFGEPLARREAIALAAPFSEGLGGGGCMCGALAGGLLAMGLMLDGRTRLNRRASRRWARELHDRFRSQNGSTCCRHLTRGTIQDSAARHSQCARRTADAAAMAAALLLEARPELAWRLAPANIAAPAPGAWSRLSLISLWFRRLFRRS